MHHFHSLCPLSLLISFKRKVSNPWRKNYTYSNYMPASMNYDNISKPVNSRFSLAGTSQGFKVLFDWEKV